MTDRERLSGELEELLDAERDIEAPAADRRARLLTRLGPLVIPGAIGAGVGAGAGAAAASSGAETAATGKAAGALGAGLKAKLVVAALAGAVGAVGGAVTQATRAPTPQAKPAPVAVSARPTPPPPPSVAPAPPPATTASGTVTPAAAPALSESAPSRAAGSATGGLRTERLLLERATSALMRSDASSALAALREHAKRFPRGELAEEREVLMVRALRAAGEGDAADKRAKDFKRQFPSSLQQGIIDGPPSKP